MTVKRPSILERFRHACVESAEELGPGVITGAADDDPSGIATYSQAGAQFGFALAWTMFLTLPFMAAIRIISACIGWKTRSGLARNIAREMPPVYRAHPRRYRTHVFMRSAIRSSQREWQMRHRAAGKAAIRARCRLRMDSASECRAAPREPY